MTITVHWGFERFVRGYKLAGGEEGSASFRRPAYPWRNEAGYEGCPDLYHRVCRAALRMRRWDIATPNDISRWCCPPRWVPLG